MDKKFIPLSYSKKMARDKIIKDTDRMDLEMVQRVINSDMNPTNIILKELTRLQVLEDALRGIIDSQNHELQYEKAKLKRERNASTKNWKASDKANSLVNNLWIIIRSNDYSVLTVEELKTELKHRELSTYGRKADLVERLQNNDSSK